MTTLLAVLTFFIDDAVSIKEEPHMRKRGRAHAFLSHMYARMHAHALAHMHAHMQVQAGKSTTQRRELVAPQVGWPAQVGIA